MVPLFYNNPVGQVLAGALGLLLLFGLAIGVAWWRDPKPLAPEDADVPAVAAAPVGAEVELRPLDAYAEVTERPAFNPSRRPEVVVVEEQPVENAQPEPPKKPPPLRLTGVVITPDLRLASITHEGDGESLLVRQGDRLGRDDVAHWILTDLDARSAVLGRPNGQELPLDLEVFDEAIKLPPRPERPVRQQPQGQAQPGTNGNTQAGSAQAQNAAGAAGQTEEESRADQIRRRIQERRDELRRQMSDNEQASAQQPSGNDYRDAIQQMISGQQQPETQQDRD